MTSAFISELRTTMLFSSDGVPLRSPGGHQLYVLDTPLSYQSDIASATITVPAGFVTDMASVPRIPFIYMLLDGRADLAGVPHDYMYSTGAMSRKMADKILYEACLVIGMSKFAAWAIYAGVRVGGSGRYTKA
jgi:hypothetical protein